MDDEVQYIDLGLSSKTLWSPKSESGFYNFDEAQSKFGSRVPTKAQFQELIDECNWTWVNNGFKVVGKNGNSITIKAGGFSDEEGDWCVGSECDYWTSTAPRDQVANYFIGWYDDEEGADLSVEIEDKTAKLTVHLVKAAE